MKNIEKSLTNYLNGTAPIVSNEELIKYSFKSRKKANEIIDILFRVMNYELDSYNGSKSLEKIRDLLMCVTNIMTNNSNVDRGIVARKTQSMNYKLEHLTESNKAIIFDLNNAEKEIEETRKIIDSINCDAVEKENKQYYFVDHLATETKDVTYMKRLFTKSPSTVNVKDKEGISLFQNIIYKYVNSVNLGDEEDISYYRNLLSLIINNNNFNLSEKDKRSCLETIHTEINKMSYNKKKAKQNTSYIEFLNGLVDNLKGEERTVEIEGISKQHNISISFDPKIIAQVNSIKTKTGVMTDREVVDEYTITIDDEDAIEIDDALTCKILPNGNYYLGVHIASVLGYFSWDSEVVQEAIRRNRSIYLPKRYQDVEDDYNRVIPIFPYSFSAQTASLIPGDSKLARSYYFEIDKNGNIINEKFVKSIVKSDIKATYEQIDSVLKNGSSNKELEGLVNRLEEVTEIISKRYRINEVYEIAKTSADDFSELTVKSVGSQNIINKIMLLTGNRVATFFAEHGYPCLYRIHESNEENERKIQSMINEWSRLYGKEANEQLFRLISGIYPKGKYGIEGSHFGMGLDHYCHCTSELRRAPDIVVEHALEVCYDKIPTDEELLKLQREIKVLSLEINAGQEPIDLFIRDYKSAYQKRR